ncbi:metallophosphoesterase [Lacihabitans lacunae]|uniref:Metallophosphoesterase n=1 Tax=Lacihabitans lacunae TaxID=1028214 RepID=A0ABV7YT57_9BACT
MKKFNLVIMVTLVFRGLLFAQAISRGPYLQVRTQNSIQVRYSTNVGCETKVKYGLAQNALTNEVVIGGSRYMHTASISGLAANSKYYYAIYNGATLIEGGLNNFFMTSQAKNSEQKIRIWATGDCGTGTPQQLQVKNAFLNYNNNQYVDAWLLLGDNAYSSGLDLEYQEKFFNVYQNDPIMKQTAIYPVPGNHDYYISADAKFNHFVPYYDIFSPVANAEMGGVPSGHKEYYSYDIGNVHFVALDSYGRETANNYVMSDTISPQIVWLKQDLAANTQKWTVVYWHHPPYTMGTHNSDTEPDLTAIREKLTPIIERFNVDLVLTGHSHNYERSKLIKGHVGLENTFNPLTHVVNSSSGFYDGSSNSCPYLKKSDGSIKGTVYAVAGSAGAVLYGQASFPHEALPHVVADFSGSLLIEVEGDRLDAKMIGHDGGVKDKFTIMKDMNQTHVLKMPVNASSFTLKSPYNAPTNWRFTTDKSSSMLINTPVNGMKFHISDTKNCLSDILLITNQDPCKQVVNVSQLIEENSSILLKASDQIFADSKILSPADIIYDSKKSVELKPGFETIPGSVFTAKTGGCENINN